MDSKLLPNKVTGTKDYYGIELERLNFIIKNISDIFKKHGFNELKTPSLEYLSLIKDAYGKECDKLIYHILNSNVNFSDEIINEINSKGIEAIAEKCLRYDLTLPFIRYVCNNLGKINFPFKRFQIQPAWRADRAQKGRFREFYQCDCDIIGTESLLAEAELIQITEEVVKKLGLLNYKIRLNSRKILNSICKLLNIEDKFIDFWILLDKTDKIGIDSFLEKVTDLNINNDNLKLLEDILKNNNVEFLADIFKKKNIKSEVLKEITDLKNILTTFGCDLDKIKLDLTLARGLGYYTGVIFEVGLENISLGSIIGGGRYNYFADRFKNDKLKAVGVSFGIQRIYVALEELNLFNSFKEEVIKKILVTNENGHFNVKTVNKLREKYLVEYYYDVNIPLKDQLKFANKNNFDYVLIGDDIKDMTSGRQFNFQLLLD